MVRTSDFSGSLSLLNSSFDHRPSTHFDFLNNGQQTRVFGFGNNYPMFEDPQNATKTPDQLWVDLTSPPGLISQIGTEHLPNYLPNYTNKQVGAAPDTAFVRAQLSLLRDLRIEQPFDRAPGVTDVKIFRVRVMGGGNRTACAIRAN
ncbi:hypothetical protein [Nannocystis pusilla]|uniref:hypothetical protein n=1 Tax=Nannocystis pusilla TaxID=889268 RepID=UPI003B788F5E